MPCMTNMEPIVFLFMGAKIQKDLKLTIIPSSTPRLGWFLLLARFAKGRRGRLHKSK